MERVGRAVLLHVRIHMYIGWRALENAQLLIDEVAEVLLLLHKLC